MNKYLGIVIVWLPQSSLLEGDYDHTAEHSEWMIGYNGFIVMPPPHFFRMRYFILR